MNKKYYARKKANNIINKLNTTPIDKLYIPLIADIMLRRQFEYDLSDDLLERDLNTFINNVESVEVEKRIDDDDFGSFHILKKKISLNYKLFENGNNPEKIYSTLAHECDHAMRYEEKEGEKNDRTFQYIGSQEAFTEMTSNRLIYDMENIYSNENSFISNTESYQRITPYVDLIAAAYGVSVKELLKASIEGKDELDSITEGKNLSKEEGWLFSNLESILVNMSILHNEDDYSSSIENRKEAIDSIHYRAKGIILNRIDNIEIGNIDEFEKNFEKIKLEKKIVDDIVELSCEREGIEKREKEDFVSVTLKYKLNCIDEILKNEDIKNKSEILKSIRDAQTGIECMQIMQDNNIFVDVDKNIEVPEYVIQEHNEKHYSNNMQWDNSKIVKYIKKHSAEMKLTKFEKEVLEIEANDGQSKLNLMENIKRYFLEPLKNVIRKKDVPLLPEKTLTENKEIEQSWALSNWDIDKEEFMEQNKNFLEKRNSIEPYEIEGDKLTEQDELENGIKTDDER